MPSPPVTKGRTEDQSLQTSAHNGTCDMNTMNDFFYQLIERRYYSSKEQKGFKAGNRHIQEAPKPRAHDHGIYDRIDADDILGRV